MAQHTHPTYDPAPVSKSRDVVTIRKGESETTVPRHSFESKWSDEGWKIVEDGKPARQTRNTRRTSSTSTNRQGSSSGSKKEADA